MGTCQLLITQTAKFCFLVILSKGAFPPSHFSNKLADKQVCYKNVLVETHLKSLLLKVRFHHHIFPTNLMTNSLTKSPYKQMSLLLNWFATNSLRQLGEQVCHQVCCKNVMVETHL
jgi:hypothetical protein